MVFSPQRHAPRDLLYLIPVSLFFLLFDLGSGSLASFDEGLYAELAKITLFGGDWLTLHFNGEPWLERPPLAVWATALFYLAFGVSEFSARLFSALCGVGLVLATYWVGRKVFDRWTGFIGALVLLTSSDFVRYARSGQPEVPFALFLTLSLTFFWLGQNRNRYLIFSGLCLGLALMTKGFAAFLVFPVVWLYAFFAKRLDMLGRSSYWIGAMLAVLIALPWHLAQLLMHRGLVQESFLLFDAPGPLWYYYVRVLVNHYHPWILVAIATAPWTLFKAVKEREDSFVFLTAWMYVLFVMITLLHSKHPWSILPVYPALSLSVGYALARILREKTAYFVPAVFLAVLVLHVPYSHIFEQNYNPDIKGAAPLLRENVKEGDTLILYNYPEAPAVAFYADRRSVHAPTVEALAERLKAGPAYVLMRQDDVESLSKAGYLSRSGLRLAANYENVRLFSKRS